MDPECSNFPNTAAVHAVREPWQHPSAVFCLPLLQPDSPLDSHSDSSFLDGFLASPILGSLLRGKATAWIKGAVEELHVPIQPLRGDTLINTNASLFQVFHSLTYLAP